MFMKITIKNKCLIDDPLKKSPVTWSRVLVRTAVVLVGVLVLVWAVNYWRSAQNFRQGRALLDDGKVVDAITFFDRTLHAYTPFNPYVENAAQQLWEIAEQAREKKDIRMALIALETIRQGYYASQSFYLPGRQWIRRADAMIFRLSGTAGPENNPAAPNVFWSVAVLVGFLGWICAVVCFIAKSFGGAENFSFKSRRTALFAVAGGIFYVLWILGMMKA
ncbi:MAG: hypothetical protein Q8P24_11710 [Desulfobacterales bacterium]|nr:hypothetical protein [Desulfobacterales bacterium]